MSSICFRCLSAIFAIIFFVASAFADSSITQYGITWKFDRDYKIGTFVTGDYWIIGPVKIISISNDLNSPDYKPRLNQNGSMINPNGGHGQGYDDGNKRSYRDEMNAGLPDGKPVSVENPLELKTGQSLISAVSWLYNSPKDLEPGCPGWYSTKTPRSVLRSAAILTCIDTEPEEGSFRPPYCGDDKTVKYNVKNLRTDLLKKLAPVGNEPDISELEKEMHRPWIDHVPGWGGAVYHPSDNMPNYGRELATIAMMTALILQVDFDALPDKPKKDKLLFNLVQFGIDLAAIADTGGSWPPDGGHGIGRKWPILFAGLMLDDQHMKDVGKWDTVFQEDAQTFYVSQKEVDLTHSEKWKPDKRRKSIPYTAQDIGMPEWGIRHLTRPTADNNNWDAIYRSVNNAVIPGIALTARIMGQKAAWSHDALFDYADRIMNTDGGGAKKLGPNALSQFAKNMWKAYRKQF